MLPFSCELRRFRCLKRSLLSYLEERSEDGESGDEAGSGAAHTSCLPCKSQGDPVHPEAVVIGNFGNHDNRRKRQLDRNSSCGLLNPQEPG
jgi:hypothetical protein